MTVALVIGSTGATGKELVKQLAECQAITKIDTVSRRQFDYQCGNVESSKINQIIVQDISNFTLDNFAADVAFYCFGSTRKQAGSVEAFRKLELHTARNFIEALKGKGSGVKHVGVVSSTGADAASMFLYPQVKGLVEQLFIDASRGSESDGGFRLVVYRPGFLECEREQRRWAEEVFKWLTPIGNWFSPHSFSIRTTDLAKAMLIDALKQFGNDKGEKGEVTIRSNKETLGLLQQNITVEMTN